MPHHHSLCTLWPAPMYYKATTLSNTFSIWSTIDINMIYFYLLPYWNSPFGFIDVTAGSEASVLVDAMRQFVKCHITAPLSNLNHHVEWTSSIFRESHFTSVSFHILLILPFTIFDSAGLDQSTLWTSHDTLILESGGVDQVILFPSLLSAKFQASGFI